MSSDINNGSWNASSTSGSLSSDALLLIGLYSTIFVLSVVGNALVIATLARNRRMRTVTNAFLLNLAVGDLLLGVFCMPVTLVGSLLRNFIFGEVMCRLINYCQGVSVCVGVWTLVCLSLERYCAICRALRSRRWQTVAHARRVIGAVWVGSLAAMLPSLALSRLLPTRTPGKYKCREVWPDEQSERFFTIFLDVLLLVIPLLIMIVFYSLIARKLCAGSKLPKRRRTVREGSSPDGGRARVVRMLFAVVVEFFVCWTPLHVVNTWALWHPEAVYMALGPGGLAAVHLLAYASACCNPITYCFMHAKYRKGFVAAIRCSQPHRSRTMVSVFSTLRSETADRTTAISAC